ncbi:unnamed protein product [Parnassius apollo]|uniref:(apollo) hypothetical protein n=1 Tax=Parnassius apollo TaxID=110799 RepID=A0A8S3Y8S9_PARAO|nr:unnamed protein product [Parnassius apollo]
MQESMDVGYLSWVNALWEASCEWARGLRRVALLCWRLRWLRALVLLGGGEGAGAPAAELRRLRGEARAALRRHAAAQPLPFADWARVEHALAAAADSADAAPASGALRAAHHALRAALADDDVPHHHILYIARVVHEVGGEEAGRAALVCAVLRRAHQLDQPALPEDLELALQRCEEECEALEREFARGVAGERAVGEEEEEAGELGALLPTRGEWAAARARLAPAPRRAALLKRLLAAPYTGAGEQEAGELGALLPARGEWSAARALLAPAPRRAALLKRLLAAPYTVSVCGVWRVRVSRRRGSWARGEWSAARVLLAPRRAAQASAGRTLHGQSVRCVEGEGEQEGGELGALLPTRGEWSAARVLLAPAPRRAALLKRLLAAPYTVSVCGVWRVRGEGEQEAGELGALLPARGEWSAARVLLAPAPRRAALLKRLLAAPYTGGARAARYWEQGAEALARCARSTSVARALSAHAPHNHYLAVAGACAPLWAGARVPGSVAGAGGAAGGAPTPRGGLPALAALLPSLLRALAADWAPPESEVLARGVRRVLGGTGGVSGGACGALGAALRLEVEARARRPRLTQALYAALAAAPHHKWLYVRGAAWCGGEAAALADALLDALLRLHALPHELQPLPTPPLLPHQTHRAAQHSDQQREHDSAQDTEPNQQQDPEQN